MASRGEFGVRYSTLDTDSDREQPFAAPGEISHLNFSLFPQVCSFYCNTISYLDGNVVARSCAFLASITISIVLNQGVVKYLC